MLNVRVCMFAACVGGIKQCKLSIGNNTTYAETFLPASSDRSSIFVVDVGRRSLTKAKMQNNVACRWMWGCGWFVTCAKAAKESLLGQPLEKVFDECKYLLSITFQVTCLSLISVLGVTS